MGVSPRSARLCYAAGGHIFKLCIQYKKISGWIYHLLDFHLATREPSHSTGCDPLPANVGRPSSRPRTRGKMLS